ncbi:MAG: hypothetical protein JNL74_21280 [Fibrobacteres bacterium]|nr:hypothetical protein [Fibrobacterota bacterium]
MTKTFSLLIFIIGFSSLIFETALTRLAAFIIYQDFVFFAISTAVCGIGIGAALAGRFFKNSDDNFLLIKAPVIFGASILASLITLIKLPSDDPLFMWVTFGVVSLPPFIVHGLLLSLIYRRMVEKASVIYSADLLGAGIGALSAVPVISLFTPPFAIILAAIVPLLLASANVSYIKKNIVFIVVSLLLSVSLIVAGLSRSRLENALLDRDVPGKSLFSELKGYGTRHVKTHWDAFGRLDVTETSSNVPSRLVYTDGSIPATEFNFAKDSNAVNVYLRQFAGFVPFVSGSCDSVLSIGTGAGLDCHLFRLAGGKHLTAVEVNPSLTSYVKCNSAYNGGVLDFKGVTAVTDEGRRFIRSTKEHYDVILLLLAQGNHAEAGGRVLAESYLMTKEAFKDYYNHLRPGGRIAIAVHNPHRASRYIMTWADMLKDKGYALPEAIRRSAMLAYPDNAYRFVLLFWKDLPDSSSVAAVKAFSDSTPANAIYIPYIHEEDRDLGGMAKGIVSAEMFIRTSPNGIPIASVSDDKPFQNDVFKGLHPTLFKLLIAVTILFLVICGTMLADSDRRKAALFVPYFLLIGVGYMGYEILLLHRLMLYLGHPTLSLSLVIAAMLISSGIAALISGKTGNTPHVIRKFIFVIPIWIFFTLPIIEGMMTSGFAASYNGRLLCAAILTIIPGFGMGFFMPHALNILAMQGHRNSISWLYGINGVASVLGALIVMSVATLYGLQSALTTIALLYLLAVLFLHGTSNKQKGISNG